LPTVPGFECSGTVVKSGGGLFGWYVMGKKVGCIADSRLPGTWSEYLVTTAG